MKCIIQRVSSASVSVNNSMISKIQSGVLILLGIESDDSQNDIQKIVKKIIELRIFPNEKGQFDQSLIDIKGEVLVVSQFTLMANVKKGRRPSFTSAAEPKIAEELLNEVVNQLRHAPIGHVKTGQFGANMQVHLVNDGPVTIPLDSKHL